MVPKVVEKKTADASEKYIATKTTDFMRNKGATVREMFQPLTNLSQVQVECAPMEGVLQARVDVELGLATANHPIVRPMARGTQRGEVDELMDKALRMFEEIEEMRKFRLQLRVPMFDEDLSDAVPVKEDPTPFDTWIDPVKEAEIALDVARCDMTVEDVDDLLTRLYIEMNRLVVVRAHDKEERRRMAREVSARIREYAGVLLESQCEILLAIERARVRSVVAKRFTLGDAGYLASLTPGSSHIPSCDGSCVLSYLPHRIAENSQDGSTPDLIESEGSRCSTPSESPSTPRASMAELQEPDIMILSSEMKLESVAVVLANKIVDPNVMARRTSALKAAKVAEGGKPAWKF
ncbi:hypothetical protein RSOL_016760 [Rhizoctonia solani AG-3 Rhs1AP]|uniref:Uncharacterized protein n=1 Tax=Rhizoctonia solani AG-3 Rhs1AP TaxID=1086054 RepID=X8IUD3_9AGAM|nr:hypothetical protein RSOL_016760 [Rhizoctonia solani AG-3 Rhs1AP]